MDFNGLSMDQAPPISAPLRFYLVAPLFGILAGFMILFSDVTMLSTRYSVDSVAIAHAITIGFLGFVMLGSLTQMLPVLAGVVIPKVDAASKVSFGLLVFGTLTMLLGLMSENMLFNTISLISLGVGFTLMIGVIVLAILKVKNFNATVKAMSTSLVFASVIVIMGLFLLFTYIVDDFAEYRYVVANVHSVWGIFGFAGILIIGVTFQVLPMFYVAPRFKQFCKKRVVWIISFGLVLWLVLNIYFDAYSYLAKIWIALFFWAFATTVWKKLDLRRRPISDVTVWYWRVSSIFLTLGSFFWVFDDYFDNQYTVLVGLFIGGGFIFAIMVGMLYKIVPFLVWFHLNAMGYMTIPTINEMINKNLAKLQFILLMFSFLGFVVTFFYPLFLEASALCFIASMMLLEYNIIAPVLLYIKIKKTKPDFDMSAFATK
ncbi:MAG: hypothetical protein U9Q29_01165 [Campylobacterota bacterium]|nr:hypothetical protein [Campylobacterota bacterium]